MSEHEVKENKALKEKHYGYDEYALRSAIAMAGYRTTGPFLARVTGYTQNGANKKMRSGAWTRSDMMKIVDALRLSPEQIVEIFLNGRENISSATQKFEDYEPWKSSEERKEDGDEPSVAEMLEELRSLDEIED